MPNPSARAIALEKGDIDLIPYYSTVLGEVGRLKQNEKVEVAIQRRTIAGEYLAIINLRNPPFNNKLVRQALYFAMDREQLLSKAGFGFGKVSAGPISSEQVEFYTEGKAYRHDPAMAEKLLDEAGYPRKADGKRFSMRLNFDQKEGPMNDVAQLLRVYFAKIGVDVRIMPMDTGAWVDTNFKKWDFDVTMGSFATGPDPAIGTEVRYACRFIVQQTGRNSSGYCNEDVDKLFEAAGKELDEKKRAESYRKIQELMSEDAVNWWLWDRYYPIAFNKKLKGLPQDSDCLRRLRPRRLDEVGRSPSPGRSSPGTRRPAPSVPPSRRGPWRLAGCACTAMAGSARSPRKPGSIPFTARMD